MGQFSFGSKHTYQDRGGGIKNAAYKRAGCYNHDAGAAEYIISLLFFLLAQADSYGYG